MKSVSLLRYFRLGDLNLGTFETFSKVQSTFDSECAWKAWKDLGFVNESGLTRDHLLANTYQATTPTNLDTLLWLSCSVGHTEM